MKLEIWPSCLISPTPRYMSLLTLGSDKKTPTIPVFKQRYFQYQYIPVIYRTSSNITYTVQVVWLAWSEGRRPLGAVLHSLNELSELSQWPCGHDDSTINIILVNIIIIIIVVLLLLTYKLGCACKLLTDVLFIYTPMLHDVSVGVIHSFITRILL